jgi:predicted GIY-YIG superfamily endonuclease
VRSRRPFRLLTFWEVPDRSTALREEARFKRLTRKRKLRAIAAGQVFDRVLRNAPDVLDPVAAGGPT